MTDIPNEHNGANGEQDGERPDERDGLGRFKRGNRASAGGGNPAVRHLAACQAAIRAAFQPEQIVEVLGRMRLMALAGDVGAGVAFLARVLGRCREEEAIVNVSDLPALDSAAACAAATAAIVADLADGRIGASGAHVLLAAVEQQRRNLETSVLEARIAQLEQQGNSTP